MKLADLKDYPDVDYESVNFPLEVYIAYAVCSKSCGNKEFIVDGETQVCEYCGHNMFRTEEKKYLLQKSKNRSNKFPHNFVPDTKITISNEFNMDNYPDITPGDIEFPTEVLITYVVCRKECGASGFIIEGQTDICEYCGHHMRHTLVRKYILAEDQD